MACPTTLPPAARLLQPPSSPQLPGCLSHLAEIHGQRGGGPPSHLKKITKFHSNSPKALLNILQQVSLSHSSINPTKLIPQWPTRRRHVATRDSDTWQNWAAEKRAPNGGLQKGLLHFTSQYIMYFAYYPIWVQNWAMYYLSFIIACNMHFLRDKIIFLMESHVLFA